MSEDVQHFDIEKEEFYLESPKLDKFVKQVIDQAFKDLQLRIDRKTALPKAQKLHDIELNEYYRIHKEYEEKLDAKYGGYEKRAEKRFNFAYMPDEVKTAIHSYVYDKGHHNCSYNDYYPDIVELVEIAIKHRKA